LWPSLAIGLASHVVYTITCTGAISTTVTVTHDNPQFIPFWTQTELPCDEYRSLQFRFSPTQPGFLVDHVTFSSDLGTQTRVLTGVALERETPEYYYTALDVGSRAQRMLYDNLRNQIYITDSGLDQVMVFAEPGGALVTRIPVGVDPVGLSIHPNGEKLYVANSGEHTISEIDLNTFAESRITIPTLWPNPTEPYHYEYMPWAIAVVNNMVALLGSDPPGAASGGPLYSFNPTTHAVWPRYDVGETQVSNPVFHVSFDGSAVGVVVAPLSSPTALARYDTPTNSFSNTSYRIERNIAANNNGSRLLTTFYASSGEPELAVYDQDMVLLRHIDLAGYHSISVAFNPANPNIIYTFDAARMMMQEARLDWGRQTHAYTFDHPVGSYGTAHNLVVSPNGEWVYTVLGQNDPLGSPQLMALRLGPPEYNDAEAPVSAMDPLSPTQEHDWWVLSWSGSDNSSGIDHYEIQTSDQRDGPWMTWASVSGTSALVTHATPGSLYCFRLQAVDKAGNIELFPSAAETCTTAGSDPTGLSSVCLPFVMHR
jgi:hypothetical protein